MNLREVAHNAVVAFLAQGITFFVSLVTSLLLPKILGVEEFGYWQLFSLYAGYLSFLEFGLVDGVYLQNGGKRRRNTDVARIGFQVKIGTTIQFGFTLIFALIAVLSGLGDKRNLVLLTLALLIVPNNLSLHLCYIFQSMNETKLYSTAQMIDRLSFLLPTILLMIFRVPSFETYVAAYIVGRMVACGYCCYHARDFISSRCSEYRKSVISCFETARTGLPHMLASAASMLIIGVARIAIDSTWGIEVFGKVSLSLSLVNFFSAFINQAGMVLFPSLRESSSDELAKAYRCLHDTLRIVLPAAYLFYYPAVLLIANWLPQYRDSLHYFIYLLPVCVFDCKMSLCYTTFFRVLRMQQTLFNVNLFALAVSAAGTVAGCFLFRSPDVVLASAVFAIVIRSLISEQLISNRFETGTGFTPLGEVLVTAVFFVSTLVIGAGLLDFVIVLIAYGLYLALNSTVVKQIASLVTGLRIKF